MKTNCWLILGMLVATGTVAQNNTNALPPIPAPIIAPTAEVAPAPTPVAVESNAPVARPVRHKKHVAARPKKITLAEPTVALVPGPAEVAVNNLNVRGQAGLKGEFLTHLAKGDVVTVLSQINLDKHKADEPAQWAKIALPASAHVWIDANFIDATNKTVLPRKLNLRAGPGENYSVLGVIERGTPVNEISVKGKWAQIESPTNAYAFVAAMYLKQEASGNLAANPAPSTETEPAPIPAPTPVPEPQPIIEPTNAAPALDTNAPAAAETNSIAPAEVDTNVPPPPRIVTYEGVVRPVSSIIAPTAYELYDPKTDGDIDYLYTTSTNLNLSRYDGFRILVTGEEGLAARWTNTPVLTIQRIIVLSTNAVKFNHAVSPRGGQHR